MNRNTHSFVNNPVGVDKPRSTFQRNSTVKTTFNSGLLVPFYLDEVLPGDTFDVSTSLVCRMATPIFPVMDDAYLDIYYFFVPNRILWDHWKEFMGENKDSAWVSDIVYQIPSVKYEDGSVGNLIDYFGLPVAGNIVQDGSSRELPNNLHVNALPFRAYDMIWNEWFRDQNLQDPIFIDTGDGPDTYFPDEGLHSVCKYHDYFTSALPSPQKGDPVSIGLGNVSVYPSADVNLAAIADKLTEPLRFYTPDQLGAAERNILYSYVNSNDFSNESILARGATDVSSAVEPGVIAPYNLIADLGTSTFNVNDLRLAFQTQRVLELDARGGTRYNELILSHFGTHVPDATIQRPEYLGGKRINIRLNEVVQQSETANTPQGNVSAYSKTADRDHSFTKSFTEHGYVMGVMCVRPNHSYSQGIHKLWTRKDRFDFYLPSFAFLGEQPVYTYEIFAGPNVDSDDVFGYQEAWAEYRYKPSILTGFMRPDVIGSLASWHYGDYFESAPILNGAFIAEQPTNIDRTLAVESNFGHQFIIDMLIDNNTTRVMPLYSVPGLIDHF